MSVSRALLCAALIWAPLPAAAADLTIMAEDAAPPFARADGTGFADDVVKAAFRAAGVDVAFDVVPYARCKKDVEDGRTPACFGMSWYPGVETAVDFSDDPVFRVFADLFLSANSALRAARAEDLPKGAIVGIVNEYEYPDAVYALRRNGITLQSAPDDATNLRLLARGRIDAAVVMTNELVAQNQKAVEAGVGANVRYAFRLGLENAHVGFSRKHPMGASARRSFNEGYKRILADGTVDALKRKWTMRPPP